MATVLSSTPRQQPPRKLSLSTPPNNNGTPSRVGGGGGAGGSGGGRQNSPASRTTRGESSSMGERKGVVRRKGSRDYSGPSSNGSVGGGGFLGGLGDFDDESLDGHESPYESFVRTRAGGGGSSTITFPTTSSASYVTSSRNNSSSNLQSSDPYFSDSTVGTSATRPHSSNSKRKGKRDEEASLLDEKLRMVANTVLPEDGLEDLVHIPIADELLSRRKIKRQKSQPRETLLSSTNYPSASSNNHNHSGNLLNLPPNPNSGLAASASSPDLLNISDPTFPNTKHSPDLINDETPTFMDVDDSPLIGGGRPGAGFESTSNTAGGRSVAGGGGVGKTGVKMNGGLLAAPTRDDLGFSSSGEESDLVDHYGRDSSMEVTREGSKVDLSGVGAEGRPSESSQRSMSPPSGSGRPRGASVSRSNTESPTAANQSKIPTRAPATNGNSPQPQPQPQPPVSLSVTVESSPPPTAKKHQMTRSRTAPADLVADAEDESSDFPPKRSVGRSPSVKGRAGSGNAIARKGSATTVSRGKKVGDERKASASPVSAEEGSGSLEGGEDSGYGLEEFGIAVPPSSAHAKPRRAATTAKTTPTSNGKSAAALMGHKNSSSFSSSADHSTPGTSPAQSRVATSSPTRARTQTTTTRTKKTSIANRSGNGARRAPASVNPRRRSMSTSSLTPDNGPLPPWTANSSPLLYRIDANGNIGPRDPFANDVPRVASPEDGGENRTWDDVILPTVAKQLRKEMMDPRVSRVDGLITSWDRDGTPSPLGILKIDANDGKRASKASEKGLGGDGAKEAGSGRDESTSNEDRSGKTTASLEVSDEKSSLPPQSPQPPSVQQQEPGDSSRRSSRPVSDLPPTLPKKEEATNSSNGPRHGSKTERPPSLRSKASKRKGKKAKQDGQHGGGCCGCVIV